MARILVIDDEENIRFTFESFLSDEGHEVTTAGDYDEALTILDKSDFDLIFADIVLGDKSGIDILKYIKKKNLTCPVVVITGAPDIETASDALRLGAFDYIPKPVLQNTLLRITKVALQHKALADEKEKYRTNLEAIFRSVKDAIITVDKDLFVVELNEAAKNICNLSRDSIGKSLSLLQRHCDEKCLDSLKETIKTKQPIEICNLECKHNSHPQQVVSIASYPLLDNKGIFSGAVLVVKDDTHLVDLERDMRERRKFYNIIGKSEKMQAIYSLIEDLADVQTTVLVTGESGTGKELIAEALHYTGERSHKPLVKVNCSALSENLLESELFGHVKGAFTGAAQNRAGRFQKADGGTIFLDEIGDISPRIQLQLLRVLQEKEFERVGDSNPIKVDVRVVAATNQNLREKVKCGEFREDLYYRLKVVEMNLPPLRERLEDIPQLVNHFLKKFNKKLDKDIVAISADVQKIFMNYSWPGNIRELEHTMEHAFILCHHNIITVDHLPLAFKDVMGTKSFLSKDLRPDESNIILRALEQSAWNKARAARLLGMSRRTIYRKMKEYNIGLQDK
ncbi:MAG: sigma 54-interacting transcriptional regulator [Candidatus Brocadia sinica]|uniref:Response regulator containing CheY-like receiver, AAA-type ATPase and DNA-binding domains n=2 Tax=Candidatus Brocadiaceae TaxID=1127830 RepID=A0ABQ0JTK3_9BACT|nr:MULTISPECIES: sigma-54 dependent transcriptional regulator [Brocadia]MCK6469994.1 sigma 54-interacting transcriptional regulator [Candidatus Brocadia sinica]GAN32074.1 response regulator containing CheY-like receiver, AAA-type ATPase and DNA-binding domains [Candidatus Brocadia sinica JPN1]GIK12886.1 MAG: sigma-54-dependent Fis family transcriptional regulator [Candidatus Brocadia sinica]GJQ18825.1 MAG: sigma-54-dependent Fis family transcriptional regulator [Candidatus Brocadia sinica]